MTKPEPIPADDTPRTATSGPAPSGPVPWRLALVLYPFVAMAVAINLFMLGLLGTWLGWGNIAPATALIAALFLGLPANYLITRWVQRMLNRAEAR